MLGATAKLMRLNPLDWALPRAELEADFAPLTKLILLNSQMTLSGMADRALLRSP